jgi:hypothetical protein
MHVDTFMVEWLFVLATLVGFGAVGGFVVRPFRAELSFAILAAPFAGLLVTALGAALAYNVLGFPLAAGLLLTVGLGLLATVWSVRGADPRPCWPCWRSLLVPGVLAALLAAAVTAITASTTIQYGSPGIQTSLGSDQFGYAHMAAWIIAHPPWERPHAAPSLPYEAMPSILAPETRFGSFATLAAVSLLRGSSPFFAYDAASAVVLAAAILGVAAVFARGRIGLVLLAVGLLTAHWYDYPRTGYFAKMLGFTSTFFVCGLFMLARAPLRPPPAAALVLLAAGMTVMYPAEALGMFVGVLGLSFLVAGLVLRIGRPVSEVVRDLWQHAAMLALIGVTMVVTRGQAAAALAVGDWGLGWAQSVFRRLSNAVATTSGGGAPVPPWSHVRLTLADLDHQAVPLTGLSPGTLDAMLLATILCWLLLAGIAWYRRDAVAVALTSGPIALAAWLAQLTSPSGQYLVYQLPGTFYPLALCAAARLLDWPSLGEVRAAAASRRLAGQAVSGTLVVLLMLAAIGLHLPRLVGAVDRFAGKSLPPVYQFSEVQLDGLAAAIGKRTVRVDIPQPHLSYAVLLELAVRRGIDVQWAPSSWQYVLAFAGWPAPEPPKRADFVLRAITEPDEPGAATVYTTRQYRLVRPAGSAG